MAVSEEKIQQRSRRRSQFPAAVFLAGKCPNLGRDSMSCCRKIGEEFSSSVEICPKTFPAKNFGQPQPVREGCVYAQEPGCLVERLASYPLPDRNFLACARISCNCVRIQKIRAPIKIKSALPPLNLVAQCSATPASVAATPPCSATPFRPKFRCDTSRHRGGGEVRHQNF